MNQCVRSPPEFEYPYYLKSQDGEIYDSPSPSTAPKSHGGGYFLLAESPRDHQRTLWSNCSEGCAACGRGTGLSTTPLLVNMCGEAAGNNVYAVFSPPVATNCVPSLSEYYAQHYGAHADRLLDTVLLWTVISAILLWCAASIATLWLCAQWWKDRQQRRHFGGGGAVAAEAGTAVGRAEIERTFPAAPMIAADVEVTCVVCLLDVEEGQECRTLQCRHSFHTKCIDGWWLHKPRVVLQCPLCKQVQHLEAEAGGQAVGPDGEEEEEVIAV